MVLSPLPALEVLPALCLFALSLVAPPPEPEQSPTGMQDLTWQEC